MTANSNELKMGYKDLERVCLEVMTNTQRDDFQLSKWLDANHIESEAMYSFLNEITDHFFGSTFGSERELKLRFVTIVGESFRIGWEAHKQYGRRS